MSILYMVEANSYTRLFLHISNEGLMPTVVLVNKEESEAIRRKYPNIPQTRTCRQRSNRHRYYVPETDGVLTELRKLRADGATRLEPNTTKKGGNAFV